MAEFPASESPGAAAVPVAAPTSGALLAYALMGAAGVVGLVSSGLHFIAPLFGLLGLGLFLVMTAPAFDSKCSCEHDTAPTTNLLH